MTGADDFICANPACGRLYYGEDGADEIFCSEECRRAERAVREASLLSLDLPELEVTAAAVHEAWVTHQQALGFTSRLDAGGWERMVPFEELTEPQKEKDRVAVRAVLEAVPGLTEALETMRRRAEAAANPTLWRVGGSPGTRRRTLYVGDQLIGVFFWAETTLRVAKAANGAPPTVRGAWTVEGRHLYENGFEVGVMFSAEDARDVAAIMNGGGS